MIEANLHDPDQETSFLCRIEYDGAQTRIRGSSDEVLLVELHTLFLSPVSRKSRNELGELELSLIEPGSELHFLTCLSELRRAGYEVEIESQTHGSE